jgi:hypothetical protein
VTVIHLFDVGSREPITTEVPSEASVKQALHLDAREVLVLIDDSENDGDLAVVDLARTVADVAGGGPSLALLRNPLARITVTVSYVGSVVTFVAHAATRVRRIRRLAIRDLGLDDATAADTSIRLVRSEEDLPLTRPIGAYLAKGQHEITLDLVHHVRPQG